MRANGALDLGAVDLANVSKSFRRADGTRISALSDISLRIDSGETVGVIGRNGSGKTTLLRVIAGISSPDRGRVERRGHLLSLIELGAGLHPDLTGAENIGFLGSLAGLSRRNVIDRRADMVEFSGLGNDIHRLVKHYSSGMLARLGFAIASFADPQILLVDEVLAVGDLDFQRKCLGRMAELQRSGCTVVLVSHDLTTVASFSDRVLVLESGEVVDDGQPSRVVSDYLGSDLWLSSDDAQMDLHLPLTSAPQSSTLRVELAKTGPISSYQGTLTIEIQLPLHPAAVLTGEHTPLTVAVGELSGNWRDLLERGQTSIDVNLHGLVPGRYLVQCRFNEPGAAPSVSTLKEFKILGNLTPTYTIPIASKHGVELRLVGAPE